MLPKFMLKKMYQKGSLQQEGEQFSFKIVNNLASGTVISVDPLKVDEKEYKPTEITILTEEEEFPCSEVSKENPFKLAKGNEVQFNVKGELESGEHTLEISFKTKEAGKIAFDVKDEL
ncbi:MAG: hypothetical protein GF308_15240 [Candidatus Heimdallarchaeota archaeon]|nr:hypothetical protein [Candidatus Heimdallarchaeota archaeon]